jgi:hypothetical protein
MRGFPQKRGRYLAVHRAAAGAAKVSGASKEAFRRDI